MNQDFFKKTSWKYKLIGPILSILVFVVTYFSNVFNYGETQPLSAVPATLFAIVVLIISHSIATSQEIEKTADYSDRICNAVKNNIHVTTIGSPQNAFEYIDSRLPSLLEVKNTSFNLEDETERSEEKFYDTSIYDIVIKKISIYVSKDLIWKDIGDKFAIKRFRNIDKNSETLSSNRHFYKYKLINHDEPQMNFIILEYKNNDREILFNWDFRKIGEDPTVLISRNHHIIEMYSVHFEHLWRKASSDHDNIAVKSTSRK